MMLLKYELYKVEEQLKGIQKMIKDSNDEFDKKHGAIANPFCPFD